MDVAHPHGRINYSGSGYTRPLSMRRIRISFRSLLFVLLGWAQSLCVLTKHYTSWEGGARTWDSVPAAWQSISYLISWRECPKNRRQRVAPGFGALPLSISRRMRSHTYRLQCMTYACKIAMYNLSKPLQQHAAALAPGGGRHRRRLLCRIHLARSRKSLLKRRVTQSGAAQM
jgi:hypothetical protein